MDLEEKIRLGVTLKINRDVAEIVDQTISSLIQSNIKLIKNSFDDHPNIRNKIAGVKIEELLVDVQIKAKEEYEKELDKYLDNQKEIVDTDIETKEAYLHKRISEKAAEALAKEKVQWTKIV